jgi:hypothetical protein
MLGSRKMEVLGMRRDELNLDAAAPFWRMLGPDVHRRAILTPNRV